MKNCGSIVNFISNQPAKFQKMDFLDVVMKREAIWTSH